MIALGLGNKVCEDVLRVAPYDSANSEKDKLWEEMWVSKVSVSDFLDEWWLFQWGEGGYRSISVG